MHPLISHDIAGQMLDDRIRDADRRRLAEELPRRPRARRVRAALGLRVVSLGARLAVGRHQEAAVLVRGDRDIRLTGLGPRSTP